MFDIGRAWLQAAVPNTANAQPNTLIALMTDLHRLESVLLERKLAVIAELGDRRAAEYGDGDGWNSNGIEVAESEVGAALTAGRYQAGKLLDLGTTLRDRLPRVRAAMARGELDLYRVTLIDAATRNVSSELIAEVERRALEEILTPAAHGGTGLTGRRLTNAINRIVGKVDPTGVRERRRRAEGDRYVGVSRAEDAMVSLFGALPAADGRKFDNRIREMAATTCPNDGRTFEQRRADAVGALVDGHDYLPCSCGREDCAQAQGTGHTGPSWVARKPLVHVIVLESTLNGEDEEPGYLDGYGLIDADAARDLAAEGNRARVQVPEDVQAERAACDDDTTTTTTTGDATPASDSAAPLPASAYAYRPSAMLDTWIRILAGTCQWPHCDAPAWNSDLDHDTPFNHHTPTGGGTTTASGMKAYCRNHHRLKHSGAWSERHDADRTIRLVSPTGRHYRTRNTGYLDLLGRSPGDIADPSADGERVTRQRRTRAQNKAARIGDERRRQQTRVDLNRLLRPIIYRRSERRPSAGDDEPCPF